MNSAVPEFKILIIGNNAHHTKSLLTLATKIAQKIPNTSLTLVCATPDINQYKVFESSFKVKVLPLGYYRKHIQGEQKAKTIDTSNGQKKEIGVKSYLFESVSSIRSVIGSLTQKRVIGKAISWLIAVLKETTPGCLFRQRIFSSRLLRDLKECEIFFEYEKPNIVIAFGDRHPDFEACVLLTAKKQNIKVIIPHVSSYFLEGGLQVRRSASGKIIKGLHAFRPFSFYRIASYLRFRNQVVEKIFYQHPFVMNALYENGMLSSFPWCNGNGNSDAVCVDSGFTYRQFEEGHVDPRKIKIVGGFAFDVLFDVYTRRNELKASLYTKYNFDPNKKLIILAVPQSYEQSLLPKDVHFEEVNFLVNELASSNYNLLLSIHPRCDLSEYSFLETRYSCRIASESSAEILACCDLFVATYTSLFVWSALCGIPAISCDFNGWDLKIYDYLESVHRIKKRENLLPLVCEYYNGKNCNFSKDWNLLGREKVFDGNTISRYMDIIADDSQLLE